MSCVNKIEVQHQEVFDKLRELVYGHQEDALTLYLNLLNKGVDLENHIVTKKDLEYSEGRVFNFQARYSLESLESDIKLDSSEEFYLDNNDNKLKRVSYVVDEISPIDFRTPEQKAQDDIIRQNKLETFDETKTFKLNENGPSFGEGVKYDRELTYEEYVQYIKEQRDIPRREGKIKHKILEELLTKSLLAKRELKEMATAFGISKKDIKNWTKIIKANILPKFKGIDTDNIKPEMKLSVPEAKIAGTADIVVEHGDGVYSIYDLKTGSLKETMNKLMKYADLDEHPMWANSMNKNKLAVTLYALMIKYNKPDARFKEIQIFKEDGSSINVEIENSLYILGKYFQDTNIKFYEKNQHLFNPANYVIDSEALSEIKKKENYKNSLAGDLYTSMVNHKEGKKPPKNERSFYENVRIKVEEMTGFDYLGNNFKIYKGMLGRLFNNIYDVADPILQSLSKMIIEGDHKQRLELNDINETYDKLLKPIEEKIKEQRKARGGKPDYQSEWEFAWSGGRMTTWKSEKWNTLTKEQQDYMNFHRWAIRYSLFSTMDPSRGIKFIKAEIGQRKDLTQDEINYLQNQIDELSKMKKVNKFKLDKTYVDYSEGWSPRVLKTSEESETSVKKYTKEWLSSKFELTDFDIAKAAERDSVHSLPLRNLGDNQSTRKQIEGEFTFNAELVFKSFVSSAVRKKHLDDAMVYAEGLRAYLADVYKYKKDKDTYEARKWIESITKAVLLQEVEDQGRKEIKIGNKSYSPRKSIMSVRNALSLFSMGFNISGMIASSLGITLVNINNAIAGSVSKRLGAEKTDMTLKSFAEGVKELGSLSTEEKRKNSKLYHLSRLTGYNVDSYNYDRFNTKVLKTTRGKYLPKWLDYDTLFFGYRLGDRFNYHTNLVAQLKSMKVGEKSMWDLYTIIDGKLVYTGPVRGVDKNGNEIKGLTAGEVAALKHKSERLFGSYRNEERMAAQNGAITGAFMQFKGYIPSMIKRAWTKAHESVGLIEMVNTGEYMVVDPKHEDYGKTFSKNSQEFKEYERNDVRVMPVLSEVYGIEEGYLQSIGAGFRYLWYSMKNNEDFEREHYNLSDYQKKNITYAVTLAADFFIISILLNMILGLAGWEDEDEEDTGLIQGVLRSKNELLGPLQFILDRRAADNLTGIPLLSKSTRMVSGVFNLIYDVTTGRRIESGKYAGEVHGWRDVVATSPLQWFMEFYDVSGDIDVFADTEIQNSILEAFGLE